MLILRATRKVLALFPKSAVTELAPDATSDTALGDWYVNRIVVERVPLLLFVSAKSRLAMLEPARDLKNLTRRLPSLVEDRLRRLGIPDAEIEREVATMDEVVLAPTRDRSILGQMTDFTHSTRFQFARFGRDRVDLRETEEEHLWITPCLCSKTADEVIFPIKATQALLAEKWNRGT